jgi:peptidoglycan/LPS O-acetylase OafA/YrhL
VPFADLVWHNPTIISIVHHGKLLEVGNIGHLWSLCVEEQFYLVWPTVVWWVRDRRRLMGVCVAVGVLALGLRFYLWGHATWIEAQNYLIHWSTFTRCDTLLVGAWLALFLRGNALSPTQLRRISFLLFWISAAGLACGVFRHRENLLHNPFISTVGYTLVALAAAGVLLRALDDDTLLARVLRWRPLSGLGVISYGFYFYHPIPARLSRRLVQLHPGLSIVAPVLWFLATAGIAWLSFRYYETPFLRLKKVLAPQKKNVREVA